jgi:putative CocE/NonD family hydrolase
MKLRVIGLKALMGILVPTILYIAIRCPAPAAQPGERVSRLGEYRGYSEERYDGWVRSSRYLAMRDGVGIAVDIFLPTRNGKPAQGRLPVVWVLKRYQRASFKDDRAVNLLPEAGPHMVALLAHGYALAAADTRGTGASFGICKGVYTEAEAKDAYEITEWLARQPWCSGRVGMVGASYEGTNQLMAAATKPPHLKAIVPAMAMFDLYDLVFPGGIFRYDLAASWSDLTRRIDMERAPAPVDGDAGGALLREARALRGGNRRASDIVALLPFRDGVDPGTGLAIYRQWQPAGFVREIRRSGVAVYLIAGWYDAYIRDAFLMFRNLGPRFKMAVLDCSHSPDDPATVAEAVAVLTSEQLRWFDFWLKGIENGVAREAPIQYQVKVEGTTRAWRSAVRWPLPEARTQGYFFGAGPSGSIASANDGLLAAGTAPGASGEDSRQADLSATSGQKSRWDNAVASEMDYSDMSANDARGLTYTTGPLEEDLEVVGHPVLHLWAASTATDCDFIAYLEEVDAHGVSHYVSEGCLRASHRKLGRPPYDNVGLPYHPSAAADISPLIAGAPAELVFDLLPVANVFNKGNRMRVTIVDADRDNLETPVITPAPRVTVYRSAKHASRIDLPVVRR